MHFFKKSIFIKKHVKTRIFRVFQIFKKGPKKVDFGVQKSPLPGNGGNKKWSGGSLKVPLFGKSEFPPFSGSGKKHEKILMPVALLGKSTLFWEKSVPLPKNRQNRRFLLFFAVFSTFFVFFGKVRKSSKSSFFVFFHKYFFQNLCFKK